MRPLNFTVRPQVGAVVFALIACVSVGLLVYLLVRGERRVALAFAVAPLTAPVIGTLQTLDPRTFALMVVFSYPLSLVAGIPAYFLFRYLGWLSLWSVVLASALLGGIVALTLLQLGGALLFCGFGAATGLVFWLIAFARLRSNNRWRGP